MNNTNKIKETDLYQPIRAYFTALGYQVNGEVKSLDVTAVKGEQFVVIELKKHLNMKLLIQGTKRQRLTDQVYIAIERPKNTFSRDWKDKLYLIRRLELGLIVVSFRGKKPLVQVVCDPKPFNRKQSMGRAKRKQKGILNEIAERSGDYNVGGSTRQKLMTAYREKNIHIACCLNLHDQLTPKTLRALGTGDKTTSILNKNFYGWFQRISRGVYGLTATGKKALEEYPEVVRHYTQLIHKAQEEIALDLEKNKKR